MLVFEYEDIFQAIYNEAVEDVIIAVNTHCREEGVTVGKGTGENEGQYRISCHGDNNDPDYTISGFALGLAMIIFDFKHGEYDYSSLSDEKKKEFDDMFHGFFPDSGIVEDINIHLEENNG